MHEEDPADTFDRWADYAWYNYEHRLPKRKSIGASADGTYRGRVYHPGCSLPCCSFTTAPTGHAPWVPPHMRLSK